MSKLDTVVERCTAHLKEIGQKPDSKLLRAVAKSLGPSIYNRDSSLVALSDPKEVERIRKNLLIKKYGLKDTSKLCEGMAEVKAKYSKRAKYRVVFYYLLAKQFRKTSVYK